MSFVDVFNLTAGVAGIFGLMIAIFPALQVKTRNALIWLGKVLISYRFWVVALLLVLVVLVVDMLLILVKHYHL